MTSQTGPRRRLLALLVVLPSVAHGADLGRLFLGPADRTEIDRLRQEAALLPPAASSGGAAAEHPAPAEPPPAPPPGALTVNGYVARSAGAPTIWINGSETTGADLSALGVDARHLQLGAGAVHLPRSDGAAPLVLKPGQSFDPASRQISDVYEHHP